MCPSRDLNPEPLALHLIVNTVPNDLSGRCPSQYNRVLTSDLLFQLARQNKPRIKDLPQTVDI